jgi:hypothetical protein
VRPRPAGPDPDFELTAIAADDARVAQVPRAAQFEGAADAGRERQLQQAVGVDAAAAVVVVVDRLEGAQPGEQHVEGVGAGVEQHPAGRRLAERRVGGHGPVVDAAFAKIERLDRAQHAAGERRGDELERGVLPPHQADTDPLAVLVRRRRHQVHVTHRRRERLLDEGVHPRANRLDGDPCVQVVRDRDQGDVGVRGEVGDGPGPHGDLELVGEPVDPRLVEVHQGGDAGPLRGGQRRQVLLFGDGPAADDGDPRGPRCFVTHTQLILRTRRRGGFRALPAAHPCARGRRTDRRRRVQG